MLKIEENLSKLKKSILSDGVKFAEGFDKQGRLVDWVIDCRQLLLNQTNLKLISYLLWIFMRDINPDCVIGKGIAGAPLVAGLMLESERFGYHLNGLIVRDERKRYGRRLEVEGPIPKKGSRIIIVDDILDSGTTVEKILKSINPFGLNVVAVASIIDFQSTRGHQILLRNNLILISLFTKKGLGFDLAIPNKRCILQRMNSYNFKKQNMISNKPNLIETTCGYYLVTNGILKLINLGLEKWSKYIGIEKIIIGPIIFQNYLLIGFADYSLHCHNRNNGDLIWTIKFEHLPILLKTKDMDIIFVMINQSSRLLLAIALKTGKITFKMEIGKKILFDNSHYYNKNWLLSSAIPQYWFSLFDFPWPKYNNIIGLIMEHNKHIYTIDDGWVYCLEPFLGTIIWRYHCSTELKYPCLIYDKLLLVTKNQSVLGIDVEKGKLVWNCMLANPIIGQLKIVNSRIIAIPTSHKIYLLSMNGTLLWEESQSEIYDIATNINGKLTSVTDGLLVEYTLL